MSLMRIAIVGAGISGLATAFYLQRARPDWQLVIYDANTVPGGTMRTVDCDGFRFEAGGNGFLTNKPDSMQLVQDAGAEHLLLPSSDLARRRFIFTDRLHRLDGRRRATRAHRRVPLCPRSGRSGGRGVRGGDLPGSRGGNLGGH